MTLELSEYEQNVVVRPLRLEDYEAVKALQLACFPKMRPWSATQFESLVTRFPDGQLCVELDGQIVASSSSLIIDSADYGHLHDWVEISDGGMIRNHDPSGDVLYGIEIMVDPAHRGRRFARRIYEARKELCRQRNLKSMAIGGRIPGYAEHKDRLTPQQYVEKVQHQELYDPVLTAQLANGFQLKAVIKDYLPTDEDSAGYATDLVWTNPDRVREKEGARTRRTVDMVRVAVVQYAMRTVASFEEFGRQCRFFVDVAADARADFVLFPELFTLQLLSVVGEGTPGEGARRLAEFTDAYLELFNELAIKYDINIIGGSQFVVEDGALHNVSFLFRRDGSIARQAKIHPTPSERHWWGVEGGDELRVLDTDKGPIAILICYDAEFPELSRIATAEGAMILFVPYNTQDRHGHVRVRTCAHARCVENSVYAVLAGCVGNLPFVDNADIHYAQSTVLTPADVAFARDGIAAEAPPNVETVLVQDLDLQLIRRHRRVGSVRPWADRRKDLYGVWSGGDPDRIL